MAKVLKKGQIASVRPARSKRPDRAWQVQTAKARFSELFQLARTQGPQLIVRRGKEGVVMLPVEQFDQLLIRSRQPETLVQFFRESRLAGLRLDLDRDKDAGQEIEL
jgi:antitoxin Phd